MPTTIEPHRGNNQAVLRLAPAGPPSALRDQRAAPYAHGMGKPLGDFIRASATASSRNPWDCRTAAAAGHQVYAAWISPRGPASASNT